MDPRPDLSHAIAELRRATTVALHNAPLHAAAGDSQQANLCMAVARQCRTARLILERPEQRRC